MNFEIAERIDRIERGALNASAMREEARALVSEVLTFHGEAIKAIVGALEAESPALLAKLRENPLVASVFELHDAAPPPTPTPMPAEPLIAASALVRRKKQHDDEPSEDNQHSRCDLCGASLGGTHAHLLETAVHEIQCACAACALLFDAQSAARQKYRKIPERARVASALGDRWWDALGLPIGMAFVVPRESGEASAWYPSPLGATESKIPRSIWTEIVEAHPLLGELSPEVEAIVVDRASSSQYFAGIDRCWSLVARIRGAWQGMTGGPKVREEVTQFFRELSAL